MPVSFRTNATALCLFVVALATSVAPAAEPSTKPTLDQAWGVLRPYAGKSSPGADPASLEGKVMCGYQGWFTCPDDGSSKGWSHYGAKGGFAPGNCGIDLWPDVSELDPDETFATPFRRADGSVARVFSSHNAKTVIRHFKWMQQYGIDGVFLQRFAVETFNPVNLDHCNAVLESCRAGANQFGRTYAIMYDLSGLGAGKMGHVIDDWKQLVDRAALARDPADKAYQRHRGKPVVAVWGIGFNDGRKYTLEECKTLIDFLENDPKYGGCTVVVGVPTGWRTLDLDSVRDPALHDVLLRADIISPWTVGRYNSPESATRYATQRLKPDLEWCAQHHKEYLPVVFPGFSWHNLKPASALDRIPRLKGQFLWTQYVQAKQQGATMIYQAMFDEVNEGTAIFKCTNDPPSGESKFVTYEGLPPDYYLWLTGAGGQLLRGSLPLTPSPPSRAP